MHLARITSHSRLRALAACSFVLAFSAYARAEDHAERVAVLTLADDAVDESVSSAITAALRDAIKSTKDYALSDAHVSLDQLSMANDCDPGNPACLRRIAKSLSVDGLVYGSFGGKDKARLFVEIKYFDRAAPATQKRATYSFVSASPSEQDMHHAAQGLIADLLGLAAPSVAPVANDDVSEAPPWPDDSAKTKPKARGSVEPEYHEQASTHGMSGRRIAAYSLLGVAIASVGLSALSFVEIDKANADPTLYDYRLAVGVQNPMATDACAEADANKSYHLSPANFATVKSRCSTGSTFQVLQFVFLGAAVVSGGASAYLFLTDDSANRDRAGRRSAFALQPVVGRGSASLSARLRF